jgi:hypothetical protein
MHDTSTRRGEDYDPHGILVAEWTCGRRHMSLTFGTAPFGTELERRFNFAVPAVPPSGCCCSPEKMTMEVVDDERLSG